MKKSWHQHIKRSPREARTHPDGTVFDSKAELKYYGTLIYRQLAGEIKNLRCQVRHELILPVVDRPVLTPKGRISSYTSDFEWDECDTGEHIIVDIKGYRDKTSSLRIALFEAIYDVKVRIIKV